MSREEFRTSRVWQAVGVVTALVWVYLAISLVRSYFFIFDDFVVIGEASTQSPISLALNRRIGFYRPAVFLMVKLEALLFGWEHAWGYVMVSQVWHATNAVLIGTIARRLGLTGPGPLAAGIVFLLSPWASENVAWMSARFDVLCVTGVLVGVLAAVRIATSGSRRPWFDVWLGVVGTAVAVFSKETGAVTPLLIACALVCAGPQLRWSRPGALLVLGSLATVAIYMARRTVELPGLDGAYGPLGTLLVSADLLHNVWTYLRSFVTLPWPDVTPGAPASVIVGATGVAGWALAFGGAARVRPWTLVLACVGFVISIAPSVWLPMQTATSAGGRFLYLPGAWAALMVGAAVSAGVQPRTQSRWRTAVSTMVLIVFGVGCTIALLSLRHQSRGWMAAYSLAETSVRSFETVVDRGVERVFVANLPFWFAEGPYVLKDFAFKRFYEGRQVPEVRTRAWVVTMVDERPAFAGWMLPGDPPALDVGERVLMLPLDVAGTPPPLTVSTTTVTLTRTDKDSGSSFAEFTLEASPATSWSVSTPTSSGLVIDPSRGTGSATLRVTELDHSLSARVAEIEVYANSDSSPVANITVRVRVLSGDDVGPPFGFIDAPSGEIVLGSTPVVLQGWALDDRDVRTIEVRYKTAAGAAGTFGEATRLGERKDVTAAYPTAGDPLRSAWAFELRPEVASGIARPFTLSVVAEDLAGRRTVIGTRTVR